MNDALPSWRDTHPKRAIVDFADAVTTCGSPDFVPPDERVAVFDNDGTLWGEQPLYAQLVFALDRAAELGHPTTLERLRQGGMPALFDLVALTHSSLTTDEFDEICRRWLASARHPDTGRPYPAMVYQPMLELLDFLEAKGFTCWIFSGGGTDFMRAFAADVYSLPPHRVIGSVGGTEYHSDPPRPRLIKTPAVEVVDDGPGKPVSIHTHVGQRPLLAAGNTDGDLAMLQWSATNPHRNLQLLVCHTDSQREYAYDVDPVLGSGTEKARAAAAENAWITVDMAEDWATIYPGDAQTSAR